MDKGACTILEQRGLSANWIRCIKYNLNCRIRLDRLVSGVTLSVAVIDSAIILVLDFIIAISATYLTHTILNPADSRERNR